MVIQVLNSKLGITSVFLLNERHCLITHNWLW